MRSGVRLLLAAHHKHRSQAAAAPASGVRTISNIIIAKKEAASGWASGRLASYLGKGGSNQSQRYQVLASQGSSRARV